MIDFFDKSLLNVAKEAFFVWGWDKIRNSSLEMTMLKGFNTSALLENRVAEY